MKKTPRPEDWRLLCELAAKEKDPKKMLELITKINQALEEIHRNPHPPVGSNAHFYSIAPVIVQPFQYDCESRTLRPAFLEVSRKPLCDPPHPSCATRF